MEEIRSGLDMPDLPKETATRLKSTSLFLSLHLHSILLTFVNDNRLVIPIQELIVFSCSVEVSCGL